PDGPGGRGSRFQGPASRRPAGPCESRRTRTNGFLYPPVQRRAVCPGGRSAETAVADSIRITQRCLRAIRPEATRGEIPGGEGGIPRYSASTNRGRSMTGERSRPTNRRVASRPSSSAGVVRDGAERFDRGSTLDIAGPRGGRTRVDCGRTPGGT